MILFAFIWAHLLGNKDLMIPVEKGASNHNYQLIVEDTSYFVRYAPKKQAMYADLSVEAEVLELLKPLDISSKPLYYDQENHILVTTFIENEGGPTDLSNPLIRKEVLALLHKIETSGITISRVFEPYRDIMNLVKHSPTPLPSSFYDQLPILKQIDNFLAKNPLKTLCHLDLHGKNVLQREGRFWIIDWEYAMMSHPYLVLASMASIERWSDAEMRDLLSEYLEAPTEEDFEILYLYRIVADLFWAAWNHIQNFESLLNNPYQEWSELFLQAALERIRPSEVILLFGPPGSGKGTFSQYAKEYGLMHISAGDLLREEVVRKTEIGRVIEDKVSRGDLVEPEIILGLIKERAIEYAAKRKSFIIDGYGRNEIDASNLRSLVEKLKIPCRVIFLDAPDDTCKKRVLGRLICMGCQHVFHQEMGLHEGDSCPFCQKAPLQLRFNDTPEVIEKRLQQYHKESYPSYQTISKEFPLTVYNTDKELEICLKDYEAFFNHGFNTQGD